MLAQTCSVPFVQPQNVLLLVSGEAETKLHEPKYDTGNDLQAGNECRKRWRRIRGFNYMAKIINGVKFRDGIEVDSETDESRNAA